MGNREEKQKKRAKKKDLEQKKKKIQLEKKAASAAGKPQRYLTDFAQAIVNQLDPSAKARMQFELFFQLYLNRVHRLTPDEAYQEALGHIDRAIQGTTQKISCTKGCSACCHLQVGLSSVEEETILKHLQDQKRPVDGRRLALQSAVESGKIGDWKTLPFADRKCVFLGDEGECTIYEARPLTCRRYFVTSDAIHCLNESMDKIITSLYPDCEAYLSAFTTRYGQVSLPQFVQKNADRFDIQNAV